MLVPSVLHVLAAGILSNAAAAITNLLAWSLSTNSNGAPGNGIVQKYIVETIGGDSPQFLSRLFDNLHAGDHKQFECEDIFTGATVTTYAENIDLIQAIPGVANVWPVTTLSTPRSPDVTNEINENRLVNYSVHHWTGVDKLHEAGMRGKGVKVAVVDTGIDYSHLALGGCFGPGCKVAGGYDLVGPEWNSRSERTRPKKPDNNPMDYKGHGTHVAGIIAGENEWLVIIIANYPPANIADSFRNRFTGVAPGAELLIFKVFSDAPTPSDTTEDVLIQAFCDAYTAGADVITASVNRPGGFIDSPWALVASRIVERGVFVSIAAGNEGTRGPFYSGVGSNGRHVVSVAAINATGNPLLSDSDSQHRPIAAYFTSWGPTNELIMKPDIGAPGYNILSTYLDQGFETDSGSSMAAPYIAGIAALYIAHHGGRELHGPSFAKSLAQRIVASGRNVAWSAGEVVLNESAPPFQVGTGLVDAWKILNYTTQVSFEPISLLDTELFQAEWDIEITNNANQTVKYTFEHESLPGVEIYDGVSDIRPLSQLQPLRIVPGVSLPPDTTLHSGQAKTFRVRFELPTGADDDMLPLYSGKIWMKGNNGEQLCIPYGGAAYDTEKAFDTMFDGAPMIDGWHGGATWSFDPAKTPSDFADVSSRLSYPCFHLRWDIFEAGWTESQWRYPLEIGKKQYIGSATSVRDSDKFLWFDASDVDINDTVSFPLTRIPRGYQRYWWFGKLSNGTQISPGNYT
ncbi:Peptidase S8/S53, subtilisin/kexin/sedolisin [Metarhizium robertsii ARSEF 23]|uniref:Peptidase S8/S53, subtilisin/kexin/sedolisin n=1 Tax=Metarhizium robertsii (strain ARSEF 23 / ATCC MYA-3075) TaxID=655844 RepID=E9EX08_METRA|nr:Peptidase S8/S53, subtilisin/kexin/sedolisin [Metarhizium robertsii ARSEF 23]EFY99628.2 Peptidase S8/S53, subtilisin/kexin/sedolisin [Metarhizium robertsii ARSEF 23]